MLRQIQKLDSRFKYKTKLEPFIHTISFQGQWTLIDYEYFFIKLYYMNFLESYNQGQCVLPPNPDSEPWAVLCDPFYLCFFLPTFDIYDY